MLKKNLLLSGGVLMILRTGIAHGTEFRVLSRLNVKDDEFTTKVTEIQQFTERSKLNKARLNYLFYLKSKCKIERSNNNPDVPKYAGCSSYKRAYGINMKWTILGLELS